MRKEHQGERLQADKECVLNVRHTVMSAESMGRI